MRKDSNKNKSGKSIIDKNYTFCWWANGIRDYNNETRRMNIITGNYGMSIDPYHLKIEKLGSFETPVSRKKALMTTSNARISNLPEYSLELLSEYKDMIYRSETADDGLSEGPDRYNYRTIEAGRISQRFDIVNFPMTNGDKKLNALGHLEIQAFPDYFSLIYELMPQTSLNQVKMSFILTLPVGYDSVNWIDGIAGSRAVCVTNKSGKGLTFFAPILPDGVPEIKIKGNKITFSMPPIDFDAPHGTEKPLSEPYGNRKGLSIFIIPSNDAEVTDANRFLALESGFLKVSARQKTTLPESVETQNKVEYIPERGVYEVSLNPTKPVYNEISQRQMLDRVIVTINNDTENPLKIPIVLWRQEGFTEKSWLHVEQGTIPVMREVLKEGFKGQGIPTGDFVQLTKNFATRWDAIGSVLYEGMWLRYTSYIDVPPKCRISYDYSIAYATWGGVNAVSHAQLCLCGWGYNDLWTELSLGTNVEQFTTNPETIETNGFVGDVRPLMITGYRGERWNLTDCVGGGGFLTYYTEKGQQFGKSVKTDFVKHGPNLSEVAYSWITQDDAIKVSIELLMGRTDDISRAYFNVSYKVLKDTAFTRLALFQLGLDIYDAQVDTGKAYGNETGPTEVDLKTNAPFREYDQKIKNLEWSGSNRWMMSYGGLAGYSQKAAGSNRVVILRHWDARINGDDKIQPTLSSFGTRRMSYDVAYNNNWEMTLPNGINTLKKGDFVEMILEWDVIPQYKTDYYGPQTDLVARISGENENSWQSGLFLAQKNKLAVKTSVGKLKSTYPVKIVAKDDSAQFTVKNGVGYLPVTFDGLTGNKGYILEIKQKNGTYMAINQAIHGNDFWQCDYDAGNCTYSITYNIFRDASGAADEYRLRKE